ncbi:MAG: hypothetical protein QOH33_1607 [Paraburkholderia sp.]|nr:hypothetical protein [Paraburkholderia sp.]
MVKGDACVVERNGQGATYFTAKVQVETRFRSALQSRK